MDHFFFGKHKFTVLHGKDGSRWLVGRELCDFLELNNISNALSKLPDDCKQKVVIEAFKSKGRGWDNGKRTNVSDGGGGFISRSFGFRMVVGVSHVDRGFSPVGVLMGVRHEAGGCCCGGLDR